MKSILRFVIMIIVIVLATTGTAQEVPRGFTPAIPMELEVLNTYPHDTKAFTQGLVWYDGSFYESTGDDNGIESYSGLSTLREVDPITGEVLRSIPVKRSEPLEEGQSDYFAEGLELVGDQFYQLTWKAETAFVYDRATFEEVDRINCDGQGWGLCTDGRYFYMSDGSQYLSIREIDTFELIAKMVVTYNGYPIERQRLNELECVGDSIYANYWRTNFILEIDKFTGNVTALIDTTNLLTPEQQLEIPGAFQSNDGQIYPSTGGVLNGIAYNPQSDTFFITGKLWPWVFEVRFVPASLEN